MTIDWELVINLVVMVAKVVIVTQVVFSLPLPLTWIERKVAGHIQVRPGPLRVGPHGLLQPLADMVKMLFKEDIVPARADKLFFRAAPFIAMVPAFLVFITVPFAESITIPIIDRRFDFYIADMNVGVLYVLAIGGLTTYGFILGGWASNSKYALLGGMRSTAQMISYEVALSFAAVGVVMLSNSLSLLEIVRSQSGGFWNWNIFYLPVGPVWFFIFIVAGIAEINRVPFDLIEDEGTLAAGFHIEYSGMRFSFFALTEYVAMVSMSVFATIFFLGGWDDPFNIGIPGILCFFAKVAFFIYFFMWIRFTLPRYRYDQLMDIGWKILIPLSLFNVVITGLMRI